MANTGRRRTSAQNTEPEVMADKMPESTESITDEFVTESEPVIQKASAPRSTKKAEPKKIVPKDVDPGEYVTVRNGFQGRLVYKSRHTGETFVWDEYGSDQEMELRELKNAKSSSKKFFENNWFMFDEDWVIDYLGVRQYYKHAIPIDHFDEIFDKGPEELASTISELSQGQKKSVAYRAKELIADKKIDSLSTIHTLEDALGIELIEK